MDHLSKSIFKSFNMNYSKSITLISNKKKVRLEKYNKMNRGDT